MLNQTHDSAASNVLSWSTHSVNMSSIADEEAGEVDEPPDPRRSMELDTTRFQRTEIRKQCEGQPSLLTKALLNDSDEDTVDTRPRLGDRHRRRSMTSNISLTSTGELTADTGVTSPSRANTPSPPLPEMKFLHLNDEPEKQVLDGAPNVAVQTNEPPKKRCISFACFAKPKVNTPMPPPSTVRPPPMVKTPSAQEAPRRPCIKFACPAPRPASTQNTPPRQLDTKAQTPPTVLLAPPKLLSPSAVKKTRSPSSNDSRSPRSSLTRRSSDKTSATRTSKKVVTANSNELLREATRFHEFASDEPQEDDWIRQAAVSSGRRLTIDDTLSKENRIRKLGEEVEDEVKQDEEEDEILNGDLEEDCAEDEDEDEDDEADEGENDIESDDGSYDSDGYHTDEETGFAASDDDEDDDEDGLHLWTPGQPTIRHSFEGTIARRPSIGEQHSDSSIPSLGSAKLRRGKSRRIPIRPGTPELPDSTDFVCGTLDEDRAMEEAYISCLAERKQRHTHIIPQDIDPSFPASEPEDENIEDRFNPVHHDSDNEMWLHGEMDDLHHDQDRHGRRKVKGLHQSPKRYRSPPPKRQHSPTPKPRGQSPRVAKPITLDGITFRGSPSHARPIIGFKNDTTRSCAPQTKSLPRPPAVFTHAKKQRGKHVSDIHVRGAIDIVKGLERKRQKRKEKFFQKYCDRARKGQIPERKRMPGQGAERMRELGLLMAGKTGHGNYVLSV